VIIGYILSDDTCFGSSGNSLNDQVGPVDQTVTIDPVVHVVRCCRVVCCGIGQLVEGGGVHHIFSPVVPLLYESSPPDISTTTVGAGRVVLANGRCVVHPVH